MDLGFEIPEPGVSVCQVEEGITKRTNENSGKTTLQIPMIIDKVIEGPEDNVGKKMSHFVPIETSFGEKQLANILTMTGLIDAFAQNLGEEIEATSDKFINAIKLKLPRKFITVHHNVRKDNKGNDQTNIVRLEKHGHGKTGTSKPSTVPVKPENPQDEDW
jgi:hypothetical protein